MSQSVQNPKEASVFRFLDRQYDPHSGIARLSYAFDDGPILTETITFPYTPWPQDPARQAAFMRALEVLHLLAGVSYYKAGMTDSLDVGDHLLDRSAADFLTQTWTEGLAELAFRNQITVHGRIQFPVTVHTDTESPRSGALVEPLELPPRALVAMGGGKDSLVSLDLLHNANVPVQPITVGQSPLIADTVKAAGLPLISIQRDISPLLLQMNKAGAWNGHVPVTAINSAILACAALLYGYQWVVFSNERSADEATLIDDNGLPVNHQYSKSLAFEAGFHDIVQQRVAPDLAVFSLLRTRSEVAIAEYFSALTHYHSVFSSCNRNFHRDGSRVEGRWCQNCPKCRFTSLALAPWLPPWAVSDIIGKNLLDDPAQLDGYLELCALDTEKPFECVGTFAESRALFDVLLAKDEWCNCSVVKALKGRVEGGASQMPELLALQGDHLIPDEISDRVAV